MALLKNLTNSTGGLFYHYLAFRSLKLWQPYYDSLDQWLIKNKGQKQKLLLIGPSAGYSISNNFLNLFTEVNAIEIDPLAPALFHWVHRKAKLKVKFQQNLKIDFVSKNLNQQLDTLGKSFPDHLFLFCNLLGQNIDGLSERQKTFDTLFTFLEGRDWISYHDLYSFKHHSSQEYKALPQSLSPESIPDLLNPPLNKIEIVDHLTDSYFASQSNKHLLWWKFKPTYSHIIQCVASTS